ncbi:MAG: methylated-DNA--[protein]-cysteine S-methyltransferase [Alphaproteobacteria bacterium]|nr:methylated-DNA--[protein]-cysteine S-methyltransferase [Alphaproteobacteria bacterium]
MYYSTTYPSPVGIITLACEGNHIVGLWLEGQKYYGDTIPEAMVKKNDIPVFDKAKKWLDRYFAGKKPAISELPLAPIGGEFRQGVWKILCEIPYGKVTTYGNIARKMAVKMGKETMSAQAVGGAVGHNPISIIIPCHRVVGTNGSLTGFSGGVASKIKLLELEGVDMSGLFTPKRGTAL